MVVVEKNLMANGMVVAGVAAMAQLQEVRVVAQVAQLFLEIGGNFPAFDVLNDDF